jgi:hypothetical protein
VQLLADRVGVEVLAENDVYNAGLQRTSGPEGGY